MALIKVEAWLLQDRANAAKTPEVPLSVAEVTQYFDRWLYGRGYVGIYRVAFEDGSTIGYNTHGANHPSNPDFVPTDPKETP